MSGSEQHFTFRWKIESKPEGGFIARADDPADTIEAATREEVEARIKEKIAAALGPDIASKLDFSQPGTQVTTRIDKKVFSLGKPGQEGMSIRIGGSDAPPAIDADSGGSAMSAIWKMLVLAGIAVIIYLLLQRK